MSSALLYALAGAALFAIGVTAVALQPHLLRRIMALNVAGSGTFLLLVALSQRAPERVPDAVPHALVLTGIVVAVSATACAIVLFRRLHATTGATAVDDDPGS